jgi:glucose 1-dehydrogenase
MRFVGNVAIVTGAAHGIGRAIALRFASEGASVVVADVDAAGAAETASLVAAARSEACTVAVDVAEPTAAARMVGAALSRFGRLDVLVANAGINVFRSVEACTAADWQRCLDVNLRSVADVAREAAPHLVAARGSIVAIASVHAERTAPGIFPYNVAKAGLVALVQSLALELGPRGVRANAILPGWIRTKAEPDVFKGQPDAAARYDAASRRNPSRRAGTPDEIAAACAFLASHEASYVNGAALHVDGGLSSQIQDSLER